MIALLLAQAIFLTPTQDGGYIGTFSHNMPLQEIPYATRLLQNTAIGNPSVTSQYEFPSDQNGYPLKTTGYGQPTVPIQEQQANLEIQQQQQQQQLQNSSMQLNQALALKHDQYQTSVNNQALQATQQLGQFDPHSDDFDARFTEFQKNNPLAFQNPGFRQLASNLVQTRQQYVHTAEMNDHADQTLAARTAAQQAAQAEREATAESAYQQRLLNEHRGRAAGSGLSGDFDAALAATVNDDHPNGDPIAAYSAIAPKIEAKKIQAKQDEIKARPDTPADYNAYGVRIEKMMKNPDGTKRAVADLAPDELEQYSYDIARMAAYRKQHPGVTPAASSSAASSPAPIPVSQIPKAQIPEGQTATSPSTGKKFIYQGGNWVPAQ